MSKFPARAELPPSYEIARSERCKELTASIVRGVGVRFIIIVGELLGFSLFGSYALLFDGLASIVDVVFSCVLILGIRLAARPPDCSHPFGHGRYEPLVGLQVAIFLAVGGGFLAWQQFFSAIEANGEPLNPFTWAIPLMAVFLLEITYRSLIYYSKKNHSPALKADAIHYRIDAINSLFAVFALGLGALYPSYSDNLDHLGAFFIALLMVFIGLQTARANARQLIDRKPDAKFFSLVREAALRVEGVKETEKILIQLSGPDAHVDIDIEVSPDMNVVVAHEISQLVRLEIQQAWPAVREVIVHTEPYYPSDH